MTAEDLGRYLQQGRDSVLRALDGAGEYDVRRPMTPTGTNLLGLVKHLIGIEAGYLNESVGRPLPFTLAWYEDGSVWAATDRAIAELPLDAPARVAWWPEDRRDTTFGSLLCRCVAETAQHAGHADILRELIDGQAGTDHDEIGDAEVWATFVADVQAAADAHR